MIGNGIRSDGDCDSSRYRRGTHEGEVLPQARARRRGLSADASGYSCFRYLRALGARRDLLARARARRRLPVVSVTLGCSRG